MDSLRSYNEKRDFKTTPEPPGKAARKRGKVLRFLVQKHDATRLHYDFRLELDGVLKSWAVTRGPSLNPEDKRLAVRTEDHPMSYGDFEGVIPKGQYGGGTVMLWDEGSWEPVEDPEKGLRQGKLKFRLHGERMQGGWTLVRMKKDRNRSKRENWLLIKERDEFAERHGDSLTGDARRSVRSGRSMEEIAADKDRKWDSKKGGEQKQSAARSRPGGRSGAKPPKFIAPQLATLADAVPDGAGWLHEIKYDGYRAIISLGGGEVVIRTRNGLDWTDKFKALVKPLGRLDCDSAVLDGEIAVADEAGHTDFGALQQAISEGRSDRLTCYLFDLLHLDGKDLRRQPLRERKEKLKALLANAGDGPLLYSDHMEGAGNEMYRHACDIELEGIISKRADAPYRSARSKSWLKVKCGLGQEFVIIGWSPSDKKGRPFSSLLLGLRRNDKLHYAGRVGSGFSDKDFDEVWPKLKARQRKTPPVDDVPASIARKANFVRPDLVGEFAFRGWTRENYVRQGSFKGLRADKPAREIGQETVMVTEKTKDGPAAGSRSGDGSVEIEGVRVTNPDRVLFPGQGVTKRDLIEHYLAVADAMLPHVKDRPLSLVRCPQGRAKQCFYQKHASPGFPDAFKAIEIREKKGKGEYLYIEDPAGLVAAVQMGVLELHVWGAHTDNVERPDRLVFDLDPDEAIGFAAVKEAAREMRARLADIGIESFLLATGGKGLHVVAPLERRYDWSDTKAFAEAMARLMAADSPDRYVAEMSKAKRKGKIFIDYLRNERGATAIAPFSSRAREGAPVAFPLAWSALGGLKSANGVRVGEAAKKLKRLKSDPWDGYFRLRQRLPLKELGL